jgi:hypothetical protein
VNPAGTVGSDGEVIRYVDRLLPSTLRIRGKHVPGGNAIEVNNLAQVVNCCKILFLEGSWMFLFAEVTEGQFVDWTEIYVANL